MVYSFVLERVSLHGETDTTMLVLLTVTDMNECDERTRNCHERATCSDVIGGFNCTCKSGFTGNGTFCEGKNNCSSC